MKTTQNTTHKSSKKKTLSPRDNLYNFISDLEALPLRHSDIPVELVREHKAMLQRAWNLFDKEREVTSLNEHKTI